MLSVQTHWLEMAAVDTAVKQQVTELVHTTAKTQLQNCHIIGTLLAFWVLLSHLHCLITLYHLAFYWRLVLMQGASLS